MNAHDTDIEQVLETLPTILTPQQVAELYGVSTASITRWADNGTLPYFRTPGGHRRFMKKDISAAIQESILVRRL